jgi:hypothetical protein
MGLDSIWFVPGEKELMHKMEVEKTLSAEERWEKRMELHPKFDPPLKLCGGLFSGNGAQSFRGKVYDGLIQHLTGHSLYQEEIPNKTIREIAATLESCKPDINDSNLNEEGRFHVSGKEYLDLIRMFRAYANTGATLHGWW